MIFFSLVNILSLDKHKKYRFLQNNTAKYKFSQKNTDFYRKIQIFTGKYKFLQKDFYINVKILPRIEEGTQKKLNQYIMKAFLLFMILSRSGYTVHT